MTTRVVTDALGDDVDVPAVPERIVSLVPSLSETLWWLHAADRVVGVTEYCVAPPHGFPAAERVRGTKNPDVERIVALEPDLVLANFEENRQLDVARLRERGVPVYVTAPRTVRGAASMLAGVGALVGAADAGRELAQSIRRALDRAARRCPDPPLRAFVPVWREPWMATGRDTYAGDLLAACGFAVVPPGEDGRYPEIALAAARDLDPDAVLLPDEPYAFGRADREEFRDWRARTRLIDGTALTWYGPRTPHAIGDLVRLARGIARRLGR